VKKVKSITPKWRTLTIIEVWVELDDAFCIVEEEEIYPGMYIASLMSQDNISKAIVSLLNPIEESIEITNLTVFATPHSGRDSQVFEYSVL
jgi:hypothetical protein